MFFDFFKIDYKLAKLSSSLYLYALYHTALQGIKVSVITSVIRQLFASIIANL